MKFFHLRVALLMVLALFAFGCNGKKVAIVNTDMVYQKSTASEKGTEYIKSVTSELETELRAMEENMEKATDKKAAQEEMQQALTIIQQRFNAEQQQVVNILTEAYRTALENCRTKFNYDIVLSSEMALSHDPAIDITGKVTEEMNALPIEFKRITPDETPEENSAPQ